tara:strand:+ start:640 stop:990 length:351 start_codon:yes stop_codon:yes gene_type:complete
MAAVDLSSVTNVPYFYTKASVGTSWQEFKLPSWVSKVIVQASDDFYVGAIGAETPSDGASPGTHKFPVSGGAAYSVVINDADDRRWFEGLTHASSIFVAAQTGTTTVTIAIEKGRE